jgi:hypothetical protein
LNDGVKSRNDTNHVEKMENKQDKMKKIEDLTEEQTSKSVDKKVIILTITLAVIYLYYFIDNFSLTVLMLSDLDHFDISFLEYFTPILLFPIGLYGFWTTKKYGWIIIVIVLSYSSVVSIVSLVMGMPFSIKILLQFLISSGLLFYFNLRTITESLNINKLTQYLVVGISIVLFVIWGLSL